MRFKKIYIEITNTCNFNCSFCFDTKRKARFMSVDEFGRVVDSIRDYTSYVYLHVLGEPLLHPQIDRIVDLASSAGLKINMTTNGALLEKHKNAGFWQKVRQVNVSLHDAQENVADDRLSDYLQTVLLFTQKVSANSYVNLRLWNGGVASGEQFNNRCIDQIEAFYGKKLNTLSGSGKDGGVTLAEKVFLQPAPRFDWPDGVTKRNDSSKTCYGLRDHIAILVEGTVVPCCIDADANLGLGNIFEQPLGDILASDKAVRIYKGFLNNTITEDYCRSCGFKIRE